MKALHKTFAFLCLIAILGCKMDSSADRSFEESESLEMGINTRMDSLGIVLTKPKMPSGPIHPFVRDGNLIYLSGIVSRDGEGNAIKGKLGENLTTDEGYKAAREVAIRQLEILQDALGDLSKVERFIKVLGMVNSSTDFTEQHKVINGYTDTMIAVFGEIGMHARSAVGMAGLPAGFAVEIEAIVKVR